MSGEPGALRDTPHLGKVAPRFLQEAILPFLGARRPEVRLGPGQGLDTAAVDLGDGRLLVATADPLWAAPRLGMARSAWLAAHLVASDLATSGFPPQLALVELNLPPRMSDEELRAYWQGLHRAWEAMGVAVIGGHTGRYAGCDYTIVGSATLLAVGPADRYVSPAHARPGDRILVTKGAAIEATGVLAASFPRTVAERLGADWQRRCEAFLDRASVVADALAAARAGTGPHGVTAMHDATEGGILGGLAEMAAACGQGIVVDASKVPVAEETRRICELFELDPLVIAGEGALLIAVRPERVAAVRQELARIGQPAAEIGWVRPPGEGRWVETPSGRRPLEVPEWDPYWEAYRRAVESGWE